MRPPRYPHAYLPGHQHWHDSVVLRNPNSQNIWSNYRPYHWHGLYNSLLLSFQITSAVQTDEKKSSRLNSSSFHSHKNASKATNQFHHNPYKRVNRTNVHTYSDITIKENRTQFFRHKCPKQNLPSKTHRVNHPQRSPENSLFIREKTETNQIRLEGKQL